MLGNQYIQLDSIDSTNSYVKRNINSLPSGSVVCAKTQTAGRGRHGNSWESPLGNLYFSFLQKDKVERKEIFQLMMRTSLAITNALKKLGMDAYIKYPNDILVSHKKICGVLIESIGYETIEAVVIGVGINIQNTGSNALVTKATSVMQESGLQKDPKDLLEMFIEQFDHLENMDLFLRYKQAIRFESNTVIFQKKPYKKIDILENGTLVLENGEIPIYLDYTQASLSSHYE
ncbi:MAG: biotin--[acetyl-CoA-carboxylase] ligase [Bacilli bacterium]|nr:biotin--[acetyl-CoA-carboxylase] ligase [Bacilli bacterium]MBN2877231.1 biotin--[acetyl-CoA-carboxylase] ligase [Bacilli bacterium]